MHGIIILAAGSSSRLGEPKQLLIFEDKTLIRRLTEEALALPDAAVVVVTGAENERITIELAGLPVTFAFNPDWPSGMGSSVATGIAALMSGYPGIAGAVLAVSDQPFVTADLLGGLIRKAETSGAGIVASAYAGTSGTPVFFHARYFTELLKLNGHEGARKLLKTFAEDVADLPFPLGNVDIDTQEDYQKLIRRSDDLGRPGASDAAL